ncbi:threonine dehydrogenase and related Zn-dependent dehydrogenases [Pelotomaculum thermopropionicum SI]|uniref:Threonine dehydrogenase and related Zn-dependent dehydrogenases n=1 Tax=Pelotomaculum thermopropionicum (strain DSM 13744 / JCM 10971 / SI) TaxID=370438 RepID=A5CZI6_PELTS|nr:threonine dehydrogenase and related Zn-dependent dehydrogenases [Pelotomaculum thermopropionicum SI]
MEIPKTCKAAVLTEYGKPLEIKEIPIPDVTGNAILVKVLLAGICGTDVHQAAGTLGIKFPLPNIQGHETLGQIVKLGPERVADVAGQELKVGDRIMWSHDFCGKCYYCSVLRMPFMCKNNIGYGFSHPDKLMGGFAEYEFILPTTPVVKVPENVLDEEAIGVGCAFRTVVNAFDKLQKKSPLGLADTVVIQGCGPIGLYSLVTANAIGAGQTIVIGAPENRLELAKKWGATHVINIDEVKDPAERQKIVLDLTDGRGAELVVECSGNPMAFNEGFGLMINGGTYLIIGLTTPSKIEFIPYVFLGKNATVIGSGSADIVHFYRALKFIKYNRTKIPMGAIISKHYRLEEINEALAGMRTGTEIKAVIDNR